MVTSIQSICKHEGRGREGLERAVILLAQTDNYKRHSCTNVYMNFTSMFHVSLQYIYRKIAHHPHYYILCVSCTAADEPPLLDCHTSTRMHVFDHQCIFSRRANCKSQNDVSKWFDITHTALFYRLNVSSWEKRESVLQHQDSRVNILYGKEGHTDRRNIYSLCLCNVVVFGSQTY